MAKSISHFKHPAHLLTAAAAPAYICDGCKTWGYGLTYCCWPCNFTLHPQCAVCPPSFNFFMHPEHALTLVADTMGPPGARICDVCHEPVLGMFYNCRWCGFDAHPPCAMIPQTLHHPVHGAHILTCVTLAVAKPCFVCHATCNGWRYRCHACDVDLHLECLCDGDERATHQHAYKTQSRGLSGRTVLGIFKLSLQALNITCQIFGLPPIFQFAFGN